YVIACDGINSLIRKKFLPNIKLNDLGLCNVYGLTDLSLLSDNDREIFNNCEIQIFDGYHIFFSKPFDKYKNLWELTWPDNNLFNDLGEDTKHQSLNACKDIISTWSIDWLKEFMSKTQAQDIIVHPLFNLDPNLIDFTKLPKNIILIGDSIHP